MADKFDVLWIDVTGVGNLELLHEFARVFNIHSLTLEDVVNVHQRAKLETFAEYQYLVTRMFSQIDSIDSEQLSIFRIGKCVVTFQERAGDCLEPLRERIRHGKGNVRHAGSDYLVYSILDSVIDHYFPVVDSLGERLDAMDEMLMNGRTLSLSEIHHLRSHLLELRRWLRPNREVLNQLIREEDAGISAETRVFLRDCYDHVIQLTEFIETFREVCSDLRDFQISTVSNRTNEVMKTLTIVSTIFIPLSFIAGLYGMNFDYMPELKWQFGYASVLALMGAVSLSFCVWFYRRGWFR